MVPKCQDAELRMFDTSWRLVIKPIVMETHCWYSMQILVQGSLDPG